MIRSVLTALLLAALTVPSGASAQATVSVLGGRAVLTGVGGPALVGGVAVSYTRSPALDLDLVVEVAESSERSDAALTYRAERYWHIRRHTVVALGATVFPIRRPLLGADHRLGVALALDGRRRADRLHQGTFTPLYYAGTPEGFIDVMAAEWEALGEGYEARILYEAEAGPGGTVAGEHLALIYPSEAWEVGASAGVAYELAVGRAALGVRADYRRFLDQRVSEGAHALDVTVRLGVRL